MGREIKRVPMTFDWPLHQVWQGYLNPFSDEMIKCSKCDGTGYSPEAKHLYEQWYGYADFHPSMTGSQVLTPSTPAIRRFAERNVSRGGGFYGHGEAAIIREAQRLCDMWNTQWCHHLDANDVAALLAADRLYDFKRAGIENPTPEQVNEWSIDSFGHDSINQWVCTRAKCERLGYPTECSRCDGHGHVWENTGIKYLYDTWKDIEPPEGEGWQVWETVTEGSPISPVFATTDEIIQWLVSEGYNEDGTRAFVEMKWSPSFVGSRHGIQSGIDALADIPTE